MALPENDFQVASEQIQDQHVAQQVPRPVVQKHGGKKLPGVSVAHTRIAQAEISADRSGLVHFEKQLRHENSEINTEKCEERNALAFGPRLRVGRTLSTGQTHLPRVSQPLWNVFSNRPTVCANSALVGEAAGFPWEGHAFREGDRARTGHPVHKRDLTEPREHTQVTWA